MRDRLHDVAGITRTFQYNHGAPRPATRWRHERQVRPMGIATRRPCSDNRRAPRRRSCYTGHHGTLAAARLDVDLHLWHGIRAVSAVVLAGLRLGAGLDFLMARPTTSPPSRAELAARLEAARPAASAAVLGRARRRPAASGWPGRLAAIDFGHDGGAVSATRPPPRIGRRSRGGPSRRRRCGSPSGHSGKLHGGRSPRRAASRRSRRARSACCSPREGRGAGSASIKPKGMYPDWAGVGRVAAADSFREGARGRAAVRRGGAGLHDDQPRHARRASRVSRRARSLRPAEDDLVVFCQGTMPAVDAKTGKLLLAEKDELFLSPDGHGGTVAALADSGAIEHMRRRGIKHLFYLQVDNPLVPIGDRRVHRLPPARRVGAHVDGRRQADAAGQARQLRRRSTAACR